MRKPTSNDTNASLNDIERLLRQHFDEEHSNTSGIDFGDMARMMIQKDKKTGSLVNSRHNPLRLLYTACACLIVVILGRIGFYFVPNWQQVTYAAVREVPGLQSVIPKWDVGLMNHSSDIETMNDSATYRGISLYVTAAYADSARTVVFLRTSSSVSGFLRPGTFTLTDQFGHRYSEIPPIGTSSVRENGTWIGSIDFDGISNWKQATGLRFHLSVTSMVQSKINSNSSHTLSGHWTVSWVQPTTSAGQSHVISIGQQVSNDIPVRLSAIQLAPSATVFDLTRSGVKYNSPTFGYVERVSDSKKYELLGGAEPGRIVTAPIGRPGKYLLIITAYDKKNVRWELPFSLVN